MSILEINAPYDDQIIGSIKTVDGPAIEAMLSSAHSLFSDRSSWIKKSKRIEILRRVAEIIRERRESIAVCAAQEGGKPLLDSLVEVDRAADGVECCIEELRSTGGNVIPMQLDQNSESRVAFTQLEPIGVVVAVSAFNHPFNLIVHQVAPAIAAGCPVLVKPAASTPLSCKTFIEILQEAGLPAGWAQIVIPEHTELATKLVSDPRVSFFSFIGSSRVGWMLKSKLSPGTRCALEHGGVAPVIIAKDADIEDAITRIAKGGFYHAGQVCVSVQRVFCDETIVHIFADKLAQAAQKLKVGDPTDIETEVGPLINARECQRVADWVAEASKGGAIIKAGGNKLSDTCYEPTVLVGASRDAKVSTSEVFGPVVSIYPYSEIDNAISEANSLPVSFQAAVFTESLETAMHCYQHLDATAVMVNEHTAFRVDWMPFAGARTSGHGVGGIPYTIHEMQIEKMMVWRSKAIT
ncbi:MAG: Sulfoacetaldehyde dehydrogenase [Alphaproteobacteria bacterium MarineAlpha11_Bin1]|nr:MAG: Sulfoacetaldehyde dehydrogenase [Alphaproteobacteria bacterium MarineAlpha11_Bin1]